MERSNTWECLTQLRQLEPKIVQIVVHMKITCPDTSLLDRRSRNMTGTLLRPVPYLNSEELQVGKVGQVTLDAPQLFICGIRSSVPIGSSCEAADDKLGVVTQLDVGRI